MKRAAVLFSLLAACSTGDTPADPIDECALCDGKRDWPGGPDEGTCEALGILDLVNTASFDELDDDARLNRRAVTNLVAARPMATLEEVDDVSYVGVSTLQQLLDYALASGRVASACEGGDLCANGVRDGDESDIDCGGGCDACALGQSCDSAADCASDGCAGGRCVDGLPEGCRFSDVDRTADSMTLGAGGLEVEWNTLDHGATRSTCSVSPGADTLVYFEISREPSDCDRSQAPDGCYVTPAGLMGIGVASNEASLWGFPGDTDQSLGVQTSGEVFADGSYQTRIQDAATVGFVVDYRGAHPVVHVIADEWGEPALVHTHTLADVDGAVHAMVAGQRRKVGVELRANFGADITHHPFVYDPAAVLHDAGLSEAPLQLGMGTSGTWHPNAAPDLVVSADRDVALGTAITVTASATDAEDGDLGALIVWENMAEAYRSDARALATGEVATYTPTQLGTHPLRATVVDSRGQRSQAIVRVHVTGTLPQHPFVALNPDDPRGGVADIAPNGRSARWVIADKMGLRANQGMLGDFRYFEIHRDGAVDNMGGGLVIAEGDLDPYAAENVPPSVSVNATGGTWQNIIYRENFDTSARDYGFAVDYRGLNPIVYFIVGGEVVDQWTMVDVFVPLYPMLYGNARGSALGVYDETLNATDFAQDPRAALDAYGVDGSALELCWADVDCD